MSELCAGSVPPSRDTVLLWRQALAPIARRRARVAVAEVGLLPFACWMTSRQVMVPASGVGTGGADSASSAMSFSTSMRK